MPDDGHRYELIDGVLIVTPCPWTLHQIVVANLLFRVKDALPAELEVIHGPFDYVVDDHTILRPDAVVARRDDFTEINLPVPPRVAIEVLSQFTRRIDAGTKRLAFEAAGVPHYWMVDPDEPSILALDLVDGAYREQEPVRGDDLFEVTAPFGFSVRPADLTR